MWLLCCIALHAVVESTDTAALLSLYQHTAGDAWTCGSGTACDA